MALLRRCSRLWWVRNSLASLYNKDGDTSVTTVTIERSFLLRQTQKQISLVRYRSSGKAPTGNLVSKDDSNQKIVLPLSSRTVHSDISVTCYSDLEAIVENGRQYSWSPKSSLALLESCLNMLPDASLTKRQDLIQRTWKMLSDSDVEMNVEHYNALLRLYQRNAQYVDAEEFIRHMRVQPDNDTYQLLLDVVAEIGDYSQVLNVLNRMKDMEYPTTEATFNALTLVYAINDNFEGVQSCLTTMQAALIEPNQATYLAMGRGFALKGDIKGLKRYVKLKNFDTKQLMLLVKSLSLSGHGNEMPSILRYMPNGTELKNPDIVEAIVELIYSEKAKDAFKILDHLSIHETTENDATPVGFANFFLSELVKTSTPWEDMSEIAQSLVDSEKDKLAFVQLAEAALRLRNDKVALAVFETLRRQGKEVRPHYYWPLLIGAATTNRESEVLRILKHMVDNDVKLDDDTLYRYTFPFLRTKEPLAIARKVQDCGLPVSDILTPLTAVLLDRKDLKAAISLNSKLKGRLDHERLLKHLFNAQSMLKNTDLVAEFFSCIGTNSDQNGAFLIDLLESEKVRLSNERLIALISAFRRNKLELSATAASLIEKRLSNSKRAEKLSSTVARLVNKSPSGSKADKFGPMPHPQNMTLDELEYHLIELRNKNMNTRGVLRKLIQIHCRDENVNRVRELSKMFDQNGYEWSAGMIANVFVLFAKNDMLDEAEARYQQLKRDHEGFKIDEFKIVDFATALVRNDRWERAIDLLEDQRNVRSLPESTTNCWRFLNAVAKGGDVQKTKMAFDVLVGRGYCQPSNHLLGILIKIHLTNGDLPSAIAEFERCVEVHKKVPLQQELLRALVKSCVDDQAALEGLGKVLELMRSIHGDTSTNSQLLMALAATNNQRQLHTLIKESRFEQRALEMGVKRLVDENDSTSLNVILKSCRGVNNVDKAVVYDALITIHARSGNSAAALDLWEEIVTNDVEVPAKLAQKFENLLISQNVPIPSDLKVVTARKERLVVPKSNT